MNEQKPDNQRPEPIQVPRWINHAAWKLVRAAGWGNRPKVTIDEAVMLMEAGMLSVLMEVQKQLKEKQDAGQGEGGEVAGGAESAPEGAEDEGSDADSDRPASEGDRSGNPCGCPEPMTEEAVNG